MSRYSRREQILGRVATPPGRAGAGDRRASVRGLPPVGFGRPLVGSSVTAAMDVSAAGMAVVANLALGVGDSVPVKFLGKPTVGARIAWKRGALVGLCVPIKIGAGPEA
jgi:hypothetical protein